MIVPVDGAELYYSKRGQGPVCLLPSAMGTESYERQTAGLSELLTLVYVDLRGGGRSKGDPADLSFDRLAADFEAVRSDVGAEQVLVLGHSIMGVLALEVSVILTGYRHTKHSLNLGRAIS